MINPSVILISGKQGSGKTTLLNALKERLETEYGKVVHPVSFADVIYEMHDQILGILKKYGIERDIVKDGPLLQLLGTEWGRKTISENIWVDIFRNKIEQVQLNSPDSQNLVFISPDCRFKNEFNCIPEALKIRLICPREIRKKRCEMWRDRDDHPSETHLDEYSRHGRFDVYFQTGTGSTESHVDLIMREFYETK